MSRRAGFADQAANRLRLMSKRIQHSFLQYLLFKNILAEGIPSPGLNPGRDKNRDAAGVSI